MPHNVPSPLGRAARPARPHSVPCLETLEDRVVPATASVFDPATATWYLHTQNAGGAADAGVFQFGAANSIGVVGDWNGDGQDGIGVFNPATKTWSLRNDPSAGSADAGVFVLGKRSWIPITGNWDGVGGDGVGFYNPQTGGWRLHNSLTAGPADLIFTFGKSGRLPVVGDWDGDGDLGIGVYNPKNGRWQLRNSLSAGPADLDFFFSSGGVAIAGNWDNVGGDGVGRYNPEVGSFKLRNSPSAGAADISFTYGDPNLQPVVGTFAVAAPALIAPSEPGTPTEVLALTLPPLDLNLLGLQVQTNEIRITVSAQGGDGKLLGNLLNVVTNLINLEAANNALNTVLGSVVDLVNSVDLTVEGVGTGPFSSGATATTPVLDLFVAPVHLDLLGAVVDTSPIHLTVSAQSGEGLVLGNVVTALANLFNPPLPEELDLDFINDRLAQLLADLNVHAPGIGSAPTVTPPPPEGTDRILSLTLAPIDLDLLGLVLQTSQIQVNVDAQTGNGLLLGNVLTTLLNTLGATPENLDQLSANLNAVLAKVIGILNASRMTLPLDALDSLSTVLQTLALPNLVTSETTASAPILDLVIASADGSSPPVDVNLLGLEITTSNIEAQLLAETGEGKVLGNLLYNVSHLLDPGGNLNLLTILGLLGL